MPNLKVQIKTLMIIKPPKYLGEMFEQSKDNTYIHA
jgi:hypothetical protein